MKIKIKMTRAENLAHYKVPSGTLVELDYDEEYIPICISSEIYENNSRTPIEAKKAQAIAARTYAFFHAQNGTVITDTASWQAFKWKELSKIPNSLEAARSTRGQLLICEGKPITAWYSNSNGGHTRRSDEAWSSYKPWTVSKPDPWDVAAREKWGQVKASHSVGMSQLGAAYAASIGKTYIEILQFYYINTNIVDNFGDGNIIGGQGSMKNINVQSLINYAKGAIGGGYCYGSSGEVCSPTRRQQWAQWNPSQSENLLTICAKWDGKKVWDCSGLFRGAWRSLWQYRAGGATTIWNKWCTGEKGVIATMPDVPGVLVFGQSRTNSKVMQHIGLYIGNGMVIDARGSRQGVLHKPIADHPWTHWAYADDVDYEGTIEPPVELPVLGHGFIKTKTGNGVSLWNNNSKDQRIINVPEHAAVEILSEPDEENFVQARYNYTIGFADLQYIMPADGEEPENTSYMAKVVNANIGLNLRTSAKLSANTIMLIPPGETVEVFPEKASGSFSFVNYASNSGYATSSYLERIDQ